MKEINIGIIGFGPKGLSVLENLIAFYKQGVLPVKTKYIIHVVEPGDLGVGVHKKNLPDYLTLNTICAQLTIFSYHETHKFNNNQRSLGPSFYEWVKMQRYTFSKLGTIHIGKGDPIQPHSILPRRILGEYLEWSFKYLTKKMPDDFELKIYRCEAYDINFDRDGYTPRKIILQDFREISVNYIFITIGHTQNLREYPCNQYIPYENDCGQTLEKIAPNDCIAINGFGLAALDIIMKLTEGRGGRFINRPMDSSLAYNKSGKEPKIMIISRSGLPLRTRPQIANDEIYEPYDPKIFTKKNIDNLRVNKKSINWINEILPLLVSEMYLVYFACSAKKQSGDSAEILIQSEILNSYNKNTLEETLEKLRNQFGDPNFKQILMEKGLPYSWTDHLDYEKYVISVIKDDLTLAYAGKKNSPFKRALDLIRDLRDVIRYAVDFCGLDTESQSYFFCDFVNKMNRNAIGFSVEQTNKLLALLEGKIVSVSIGPSPKIDFDRTYNEFVASSSKFTLPYKHNFKWFCVATIENPSVDGSQSILLQNLFERQKIFSFRINQFKTSGISLTEKLLPCTNNEKSLNGVWVIGPLSEGVKFYNHYVPSPNKKSKSQEDISNCILQLIDCCNREEEVK